MAVRAISFCSTFEYGNPNVVRTRSQVIQWGVSSRPVSITQFAVTAFWLNACCLDELTGEMPPELEQARAAVQTGLALHPNFTIRAIRESRWSDVPAYVAGRDRLVEALQLAGVPEG